MKLQFKATTNHYDYTISDNTINNIDLSEIQPNESFSLPELQEVGIVKAERDDAGELYVVLEQACLGSRYGKPAHWRENSVWIDSAEYDSNTCYIIPTGLADVHDYKIVWIDESVELPNGDMQNNKGWCVIKKESEEGGDI